MRLLSPHAAMLIMAFLRSPNRRIYGYELLQETGMKSGSLYPVLGRFEKLGWITGEMQDSPGGRPPRRVYTLDPNGRASAQEALDRYVEVKGVPVREIPALGM